MQQFEATAIGEHDHQIHYDEHQIVVPAIGFFSPETGVPYENLFIDCAQHNQDQAQGGELGQNTENGSQAAQDFAGADQDREVLVQPMLLLRASGSLRWFQPLVIKTTPTINLSRRIPKSAN